ncbi:Visual pigment-like receptor peropsin [Holothuria leucospilota]|uniref:Visual pigment-like receptor peropsin n=1 Tax=Holothuria leucospilota TaxID=206669 RepID=A0A9Q1BF48_HOLLE|nr:Visual pigment-like receptor peropsin [Holothuria leucospilota]
MEENTNYTNSREELSSSEKRVFAVAFSVEGIVGIFCALYSLRCSLKYGQTYEKPLRFYTSLAIADLGIAVLCPITAYGFMVTGGWPFSEGACDTYGFLAMFFGSACIWSLLMTALESLMVFTKTYNETLINMLLMLTWLNALFWSSAPLLGWGRYVPEIYDAGCLFDMNAGDKGGLTYLLGYSAAALILPMGILLCAFIFSGCGDSLRSFSVKACSLVTLAICICWGTYCLEEIWVLVTGRKDTIPIRLAVLAPLTAKLSPIVDSFIIQKIVSSLAPPNQYAVKGKKE